MMPSLAFKMQSSVAYSAKVLLGAGICWYLMRLVGIPEPQWAMITVMLVTDVSARWNADAYSVRIIDTALGCIVGMFALVLFGCSVFVSMFAVAVAITVALPVVNYPSHWRLAPAMVMIVMAENIGMICDTIDHAAAMLRVITIFMGCAVVIVVALGFDLLLRFYMAMRSKY